MIAYHELTANGVHILRGGVGTASLQCSDFSLTEARRKFALCMKYVDEIPVNEPLIIRVRTGAPVESVHSA